MSSSELNEVFSSEISIEDFKNKVTKAQEDLFKSLDNERTKARHETSKVR